METALIIAGIQAAVALLQSQIQLAAAQVAATQGKEREALLAAMQAAYLQAADANSVLAKALADHKIFGKEAT